jgi:hypothetical protein
MYNEFLKVIKSKIRPIDGNDLDGMMIDVDWAIKETELLRMVYECDCKVERIKDGGMIVLNFKKGSFNSYSGLAGIALDIWKRIFYADFQMSRIKMKGNSITFEGITMPGNYLYYFRCIIKVKCYKIK